MAAEVATSHHRRQSGVGQCLSAQGAAVEPRQHRRGEQADPDRVADGVHEADPLLRRVQLRPVGPPGDRRRHGRRAPCGDQRRRGRTGPRDRVEDRGGGPGTDRHVGQHRVQRVTEPQPVQRVAHDLRPQGGVDDLANRLHHRVQRGGVLDPVDHGLGCSCRGHQLSRFGSLPSSCVIPAAAKPSCARQTKLCRLTNVVV